jgi:hypothetical protein
MGILKRGDSNYLYIHNQIFTVVNIEPARISIGIFHQSVVEFA